MERRGIGVVDLSSVERCGFKALSVERGVVYECIARHFVVLVDVDDRPHVHIDV